LALKKTSSIRHISDLLSPTEEKFILFEKDVGNDKGVALGSGWDAPLGLGLAPTARFSQSPGQRPGTKDRKKLEP
jgi:hypothetical protein